MRKLIIRPRAKQSIYGVAEWIAEKNFPETGQKFIQKVEKFLFSYCDLTNIKFPFCNNQRLARRKMSCVIFNRKWVIAFKYTKKELIVYEFIWGRKLR